MMTTCGICGKRFVVTWPQHWVYKRKDVFLCGEDCMIVYDTQRTRAANGFGPKKKGAEENMAGKLTQKQKKEVIEIAIKGGSPIEYLKRCGIGNPYASWDWIKKSLANKDPQKYLKLSYALNHKKPEQPAEVIKVDRVPVVEIPEQSVSTEPTPLILQGGVDYQMKVDEDRKPRKPFKVIGLETDYGRFTMGTVDGVLRFQAEGEAEISMVAEDWLKLADTLPEILRELGVEA